MKKIMRKIINILKPTAPLETLAWLRFHTTFSLHMRAHKFGWYKKWHSFRFHQHAHAFVLAVYALSILTASVGLLTVSPHKALAANTVTWDLNTSSEYTYDSSKIEFVGGWARLKSTGGNYPTDNPTIVSNNSHKFNNIKDYNNYLTFSDTMCDSDNCNTSFQLSNDNGATWYWYNSNSGHWHWEVATEGYTQSTRRGTVSSTISQFTGTFGSGTHDFKWKAFLHAGIITYQAGMDNVRISIKDTLPPDNVASVNGLIDGWSARDSGTSQSLVSTYFTDANTGYIVGGAGTILKTTNGGTDWTAQTSGTGQGLNQVHFVDTNNGYIVGWGGVFLKTTNGGTDWTVQTPTGGRLLGMHCIDANNVYIVGDGGTILKTTNGGTSWNPQTSGTGQNLYSISFPDSNDNLTGYIIGDGGTILKTTNGGTDWDPQTSGTSLAFRNVYFTDNLTGYIVGWTGTFLKTIDGGTNWTVQIPPSSQLLNGIYFTDANTGYIVGNSGTILKTTNGGTQSSINSGEWHNNPNPYFTWDVSNDYADTANGETVSGIYAYYGCFSIDSNCSPGSNPGYFGVTPAHGAYLNLSESSPWNIAPLVSGQTYYIRMKVADNDGNYSSASQGLFTYKYDADKPTNPSVERNPVGWSGTNSFTFTFSGAADTGGSGIKGYEYKRETDNNWTYTASSSVAGIQAYQNGTNVFQVRTLDNAGNTADGYTSVNYYYSGSAPSAPQNLSVNPNNNTQNNFNFTWQTPATYDDGIKGYKWSVNAVPSASNTVYTTSTTTGSIPAATQQGLNTFYVVAVDSTDKVNYANYASVQFEAATAAPGAPTAPVISDISDRNTSPPKWALALSWNAPTSGAQVDHYIIQRSTDQNSWSQVGTATSRAFAGSGLDSSTIYYYRIIAADGANAQSAPSSTVSKQPTGKYVTHPDIRPPSVRAASTTATITWSTDRASSSFIQYGKTFTYGASNGSPDSATTHTVTLNGLEPGTTYHFRQQSYDENRDYTADSAVSQDYTFTTLPPPGISDVKFSDISLSSAIVTWKTTSSATSSFWYGKTNTYGKEYFDSSGSSTTNHTAKLAGLDHSSTYHLKLFGTDTDGNTMQSDDYTFDTLTMPKILNLKVEQMKGNRATLRATWDSNVPTTSTVDSIEGSGGKSQETTQSELTLKHDIQVSRLKDDTDYTLTIVGRDAYGNEGNSETRRVRTAIDTTPPEISEITNETSINGYGQNAKSQMVVSWYTDEPSTSQVEYSKGVSGDSFPLSSQVDMALVTSHVVVISDLDPSSSYYFRVASKDKSGNEAKSEANSSLTEQARSSILDIVIQSFQSTLGWLFGSGKR